MPDQDQIRKLIAIETNAAKKKEFRKGLLIGIFIPILIFSIFMTTVILSHTYIEKRVGQYLVSRLMGDLFSAFPDAYFTTKRERIITIIDDFTNAASNHKIDSSEFNEIGRQFFSAIKDKRLTYGELDKILELMEDSID